MDGDTQIDVHISLWILEFLLRQPLDDRLVTALLHTLPLPIHSTSLEKILLLRKIESEVVSNSVVAENTLQFLEQIAELDFQDKIIEASDSLKSAYCAVAVDCTVKLLKSDNKASERIDAVQRIWSCKQGLVTDDLLDWKDKIEAALNEQSIPQDLVKKSEVINAVEAVKVYVTEEKAKMGPSFLEVVAETLRREGDDAIWELIGLRKRVWSSDQQTQNLVDGDNNKADDLLINVRPSGKPVVRKALRVLLSKASRGAKIAPVYKSGECPSGKKYDLLAAPEVNKVQGELESSPLQLQVLVKDPLTDALCPADTGVSGTGMENMDHVPLQEKKDCGSHLSDALRPADTGPSGIAKENREHVPLQKNKDGGSSLSDALHPAETGVSSIAMENRDHVLLQENKDGGSPSVAFNAEILQPSGGDVGNDCSIPLINAPKPIKKRNDSVSRSPEDSPFCQNVIQPRPRKRVVSPSQKNDVEKLKKRRKIKRWSIVEEDTLRTGVEKYGKGNWKLILFAYHNIFKERNEVDLKDKWRNMTR